MWTFTTRGRKNFMEGKAEHHSQSRYHGWGSQANFNAAKQKFFV
jgi:hypothetical protein